jgi:integrase
MTTWHEPVTAWSNDLQAGGAAADTVRLYRTYLARWARVCDRPDAATHETIVAWLAGHEWQPETRKSARTAVQSFYRWAHRRGLLPLNPAADLPAIRIPEATPRPAPDADIRAALARARADVRLMLLLGSVDGLRRAEIARVHTTDVDTDDTLTVRGKGGKVRRVPLPPSLARAIRELPPGWVFPSPVRAGRPITAGCAGRWMSQVLPPGVTPHMLRHAAATSMHEDDGLSLLEIRRQLGHANVATTQRYVAVRGRRTRAAMAARAGRLAS